MVDTNCENRDSITRVNMSALWKMDPTSPCGLRFEPDILVSIHGSAPGFSPHFRNPEKLLDGVYKRVLGKCGSATASCTFDFNATGYWPISHASPLR